MHDLNPDCNPHFMSTAFKQIKCITLVSVLNPDSIHIWRCTLYLNLKLLCTHAYFRPRAVEEMSDQGRQAGYPSGIGERKARGHGGAH